MAFGRVVLYILFLTVSSNASNVPVFIWGDQTIPIKANPLETISTNDFATAVRTARTSDPLTVVFIEPTLSPEDISSKDAEGGTPLAFLAEQTKAGHFSYLPAVDNPVEAIDRDADPTEVDRINLSEKGLSAEIQSSNHKYLFINLNDAEEGETRIQLLERHNDYMKDMYGKLKKHYLNVLAIYTGRSPSWIVSESHSRVRRQAASSNLTADYILEGVKMFVERIVLNEGGQEHILDENPTSSMVMDNVTNVMNTTVTFGERTFVMNFKERNGYWYFDSVTFNKNATNEEIIYPSPDVYALKSFSYRCGQKTVFRNVFAPANSTRTLTFINLQIQPFFGPINDTNQFGESFDCIGFFSGPIWSGLMVTFIILAITFYGIMMMMDIKTMDRFDDPKGKTITINTSE